MTEDPSNFQEIRKKRMLQARSSMKNLQICKSRSSQLQIKIKNKNFTSQRSIEQTEPVSSQTHESGQVRKRSASCFSQLEQQEEQKDAFEQVFRMQQKIGEGAHGVVKKCVSKNKNKDYAVKLLKMQDEHYRSYKTNFINIKQLNHQNVVQYKALYLNPKKRMCHLVMEFLPYSELKKSLKLEQDDLKYVFRKIFDAIDYIHSKNICHRDIKPTNILYDPKTKIVKIIDFGISKNLKIRGRYEEMYTNTGTIYYKAPEMFEKGSYTEKVDCWAAGITLYEMITGETPFESEYHTDTIENICYKQLSLDRKEFESYDPLVKDLLLRLLNKNPNQRMNCTQAKKHLWFTGNYSEVDIMKSAVIKKYKSQKAQKQEEDQECVMIRRSSVNDYKYHEKNSVSKVDKQIMKNWLSIINENDKSSVNEEYRLEFAESEDEQDNLEDLNLQVDSPRLIDKKLDSMEEKVSSN